MQLQQADPETTQNRLSDYLFSMWEVCQSSKPNVLQDRSNERGIAAMERKTANYKIVNSRVTGLHSIGDHQIVVLNTLSSVAAHLTNCQLHMKRDLDDLPVQIELVRVLLSRPFQKVPVGNLAGC